MATTNSSFLGKINNSAGQMSDLSVSDARTANLSAGNLAAANLTVKTGNVTYARTVGFASTAFATATAGSYTLLSSNGQPAPSASTDSNVVTLPAGAVITRVIMDNNGTTLAGGTSYAVSVGAFNGAASVTPMAATALAVVNGGGTSGVIVQNTATNAVAGAGVAPLAGSIVPASPNNYLNVTLVGTNTAGDLRVTVDYYLLG